MDIQKVISELVGKLTGNKDLIGKFTADPGAIIKQLTGLVANQDQIKQMVAGVTKALGINANDIVSGSKGFLAKLKSFFGLK